MAWIELHQAVKEHKKTYKFAKLANMNRAHVVGHLCCLWLWAIDNTQNGTIDDADVLAGVALWDGDADEFINFLTESGWVDRDENGNIILHDWEDYAGKLTDRRSRNAQRMRELRANSKENTCNTRAAHVQDTCKATVQYSTVPNNTPKSPVGDGLLFEDLPEQSGKKETKKRDEEDLLVVRQLMAVYPLRKEDTELTCLKAYRATQKLPAKSRPSFDVLMNGVKNYAAREGSNEYRFKLSRWLRDGYWANWQTATAVASTIQSSGPQMEEVNPYDKRR